MVTRLWRTATARALHTPLAEVLGGDAAKALDKLGLATVDDLMHHLPRHYLSGTETTNLSEVRPGEYVALVARVGKIAKFLTGRDGKRMYPADSGGADSRNGKVKGRLDVILTDGRTSINATFFGWDFLLNYWTGQLRLGIKGIFVSKVGEFRGQPQMSNPDFVMLDEHGSIVGRADEKHAAMARQVSRSGLVGIYPAMAKLPTWVIGECANIALDGLKGLPDSLPEDVVASEHLPGLTDAFDAIHRPDTMAGVEAAMTRLKFEEALALQVTMARRRAERSDQAAPAIEHRPDGLEAALLARLPFALTPGQKSVSAQIAADMAQPTPMQRLLQGEVGAGKTVVALLAMLAAVDAGHQAVLLAPTEVLAAQHATTIEELMGDLAAKGQLGAPPLATRLVTVTAGLTAIARRHANDAIASGEAGLIVGTHALLYGMPFKNLGFVVIDEQHRFGVEQRAVLTDRPGLRPHVLVLTATPIPRSVAMTVFGDLEMSTLTEVPTGRGDVATTVVALQQHPAWLDRAWQRVREEVNLGRQAFIVCPRINARDTEPATDEPSAPPSAAATELIDQLAAGPLAGLRLGLLHGRLSASEKSNAMARFVAGETDVLVCTTIIEVGVDVPNASMMVVLDADRFGISQLHQLRGRVGRGKHDGVCLLVTNAAGETPAAARLRAVASTRDGFKLAEFDLMARREGDVLGAEQSGGRSTLRLLRAIDDADLIRHARQIAENLVANDPGCEDDRLADLVAGVEDSDWLERS